MSISRLLDCSRRVYSSAVFAEKHRKHQIPNCSIDSNYSDQVRAPASIKGAPSSWAVFVTWRHSISRHSPFWTCNTTFLHQFPPSTLKSSARYIMAPRKKTEEKASANEATDMVLQYLRESSHSHAPHILPALFLGLHTIRCSFFTILTSPL